MKKGINAKCKKTREKSAKLRCLNIGLQYVKRGMQRIMMIKNELEGTKHELQKKAQDSDD